MEINIKDKLKNLSGEKIKGSLMHDFGIGRIVIIIICGVVILAGSLFDGGSVVKESDSGKNTENENILSEDDALDIMNKYAKQQEIKLKTMLESMDGVGEVKVMVTLASSEEKVALKDTETGENKGKDTDSVSKKSESVLIKNNGDENPYVVSVTAPKIAGVAVVCEGADGGKKDSEIIEMIGSLFDIESHKIKITRMTA